MMEEVPEGKKNGVYRLFMHYKYCPVSSLLKSISNRYQPDRVPVVPITAIYTLKQNASFVIPVELELHFITRKSSLTTPKRPISVHGSHLLAELVDILAVVEHLHTKQTVSRHVRIFSDSQ